MEEEYIEKMCAEIVAFHPDIVITEKGVSGQLVSLLCGSV
jgi:T-complex protein 1 subunit gamma